MSAVRDEIELQEGATMNKVRNLFQRQPQYEPIENEDERLSDDIGGDSSSRTSSTVEQDEHPFSWIDYSIFFLLGIAMLWAW